MDKACTHLKKAWELNPKAPEPAVELMDVALAGRTPAGETPRFWFDRAVSAELDYEPAYSTLRHALLPRWGGSHRQMYAFGRECLDTKRFDTNVPYHYFETLEYMAGDIGVDADLFKSPAVYADLQTMIDGYLAEPSMAALHDWYRSLKIAAAVRSGQWEDARRLLDALNGEPQPDGLTRLSLKPDEIVGEIYARTGEFAEKNHQAQRLLESGKVDEAEVKYEDLIGQAGDRQSAADYFRRRLAEVTLRQRFAAGEWQSVLPDAALSGWRVFGGKWTVDDQGRLIGEAQQNGLRLANERKLGTRLEIRGKATFVASAFGEFNIGIYFGQENGQLPNSFRIDRSENYAAIATNDVPLEKKPIAVGETNTFRVQRWDDTLSAYLNDELIADGVAIDSSGDDANEVFGVGGRYWYVGPLIRFEELEVRKLDQRPVAENGGDGANDPAELPVLAE
jgi:hypothetical protein